MIIQSVDFYREGWECAADEANRLIPDARRLFALICDLNHLKPTLPRYREFLKGWRHCLTAKKEGIQ